MTIRTALGALFALLLTVAPAAAQTTVGFCGYPKVQTPGTAIIVSGAASQTLNVSTTAQSLTIPVLSQGGPIIGAYVQVLLGMVKVRHDGTAPKADSDLPGDVWGPGGTTVTGSVPYYVVCGSDLRNFQMIQYSQSATSARVNVKYYMPGQ